MHLDKLAVRVVRPLLIQRRLRRPRAHHRVRALPEDRAIAARADDDRVRRKRPRLHRAQVHRADTAARALAIQHRRQELPALVLRHLAFGLMTPHLLVQRIQKLLPRRRPRKRRPLIQRPAKPPEIQQPLRRPVERHTHAVQQVDDRRPLRRHVLHRRLVGQKVAAIDRVVEVLQDASRPRPSGPSPH